ncbi:MAG: tetratricopeptide repeat protein [Candidatus Brocadiaceae bacterium]|nr:tetratricopeptide repeat protein [Candidatus Brocadiaceae bacterium]
MFFIQSFSIVWLVLFFIVGFLGCRTVTVQHDNKSVSSGEARSLNTNERAYSYFCTGYYFLLERDWENAVKNFEKALQWDDSSERIIQHLATCYFQLGKNEKAIDYMKKLAVIKPDEFSVRYTLATLYETVEKFKEAIKEYENARRCKTTKLDNIFLADVLYRLANLYINEGAMEKGVDCYQSMFDLNLINEPVKIYYEIGQKYFEKNEIKKAREYFLKAKQADPKLSFTSFYLTLCYDMLKDYDNAIKEAMIFLEKEPDNWAMHLALSEIYDKTRNEPKKNEEIKRTQEILKRNTDAGTQNPKEYFLLCQIYKNQRKIDDAISVIENMKTIPLDKETMRDAHFLLANLYYENENFDRAEEELKITLMLDPEFHEANNFLGYLFVENNKNLDLAMQLINKALKADPENGAYLDSLGWAYYKKAQQDGRDECLFTALKILSDAVQRMEEPDIYDHIGEVYYSLGQWDEAVKAWEKTRALYNQTLNNKIKIVDIEAKLKKIRELISAEEKTIKVIKKHNEVENVIQP